MSKMTAVPQFQPFFSEDSNNEESTNELAIAPENADDFDALNDETFGAATFDEDWEQQHEQLASTVSGPSPNDLMSHQQEPVSNIQQPRYVNQLEAAFNMTSENNDASGWSPFSREGFLFNLKPTVNVNDENIRSFASMSHGKPGSGDSLTPNAVQTKLPAGFNVKPGKPMTLDEVERLLLAENNDKSDNVNSNNSNMKPADNPGNPLNKFFPGVNLLTMNNQEKKISTQPTNMPVPNIPTSEPNGMRPFFPPPILPGYRPFNQQIGPAGGLPRMMVPPFLPFQPGPIHNPAFIQMEQLLQFQRRFPHQRRQFNPRPGGRFPHQERNDDEYAGLMTQSNKEWLIKIQSSALNFANPYKEDFYFVSHKSKQLTAAAKAKKSDDGSQIPSLIIPERKAEESTKVEYVPVQFEGSLGKIQVANIKCPRKLLDVDVNHPTKIVDPSQDRPATPVGRAELNAFRRLLLDIEQLYVVMLDIDEEDKKMGALPEDQRTPHEDKRRELCNQLFRGVYDERANNINKRTASVRKGVALIVRSLQVLSDVKQKAAIVKSLLDPSNSHYLTNYREKGLHQLDLNEILTESLTQLRESNFPEIDDLTNSLNTLEISKHQSSQSNINNQRQ